MSPTPQRVFSEAQPPVLGLPPIFRPWLATLILITVPLLLYVPALQGQFVYFDSFEIQGNSAVTNPAFWLRNFTQPTSSALAGRGHYYRPLYFLAYGLVYQVAGARPIIFHLLQVLLFAFSAGALFWLGWELLGDEVVAFVGALLWSLHPAHVEAVAWISSLCDVGCALAYFLAFWLFLRAEKAEPRTFDRHFPAAAVFLVALLFKEMAYSFPLLLLAYWYFLGAPDSWRRRATRWLPYAAVFCGYLLLRVAALGSATAAAGAGDLSWPALLRDLTLLGEHTRIFFWPTHLSYGRMTGLSPGPLFPWPLLALAAGGAALALRRHAPRLAFLVFFWMLTLAPALDIRQITFPYAADRFSYLPSAGLCLALSYLLFELLPRRIPALRAARLAIPATLVIAALWAWQTSRTIPHWRSDDAFSAYSLQDSPTVPIFHTLRGRVLATQKGDWDGAAREFETALRLSESAPEVWRAVAHDSYMGLGNVALQQGRFPDAARFYRQAAAQMPGNTFAYKQLAALYLAQNDLPDMADVLAQVVKLDPQDLQARFNLGVCWLKMGKYGEAEQQFLAVAARNPQFPHLAEAENQATLGQDQTLQERSAPGRENSRK